MARPVHADAEGTRRRILAAAWSQFSAEGIDGTSMRDVAAAAGVNIATVHHYFVSKDGLAEACIDAAYAELATLKDALVAAVRPDQPFAAMVEDGVRTAWRFSREHRAAHRMLLRIVLDAERVQSPGRARRAARSAAILSDGARLLAAVTGRSERDARLVVQTLSNVVTRWALAPADELAAIVLGDATDTDAAADSDADAVDIDAVVEEHLIDLTFRLLGLERTVAPRSLS